MSKSTLVLFSILISLLLMGCQGEEEANKQPSPEEMQQLMGAMMNGMSPAMAQMTEMMINTQVRVAAQPETAHGIAIFKKNLFDNLQRQGFNEQQAMQIVLTTQLPGASASK